LLRSALSKQPTLHEARFTLAAVLADRGQRRLALVTLLDGVGLDAPRFAATAAQLQVELDDAPGALMTLDRVPAAARGAADHWLAAAIAQRAGRHEQAVDEYSQSLRADPSRALSWAGLGVSLQALGRDQPALDAFRRAMQGDLSPEMRRFMGQRIAALESGASAASRSGSTTSSR